MIKISIILMFIFYPTMQMQIFGVATFGVSSTDFIIMFLNLFFMYKFFWEGVELKIPKTSIHIYIFILFLTCLFSAITPLFTLNEKELLQFLKTFSHFLYLYFFLFLALSFKIDSKTIFQAIKIYLITAILCNLYGIYQLVARALDLPFGWVELNHLSLVSRSDEDVSNFKQLALKFKDFYRATSIFSEPSSFVQFNLIGLCFIAIPYITKTKKVFESNFYTILSFVLIVINLFITFSLTAVLGITLLVSTSVILEKKQMLKLYFKIFLFVIILLLISDYFISDLVGISILELIFDRIIGVFSFLTGMNTDSLVEGESLTWRIAVILESLNVWFKNPITGVGLGLFFENSNLAGFSDNSFLSILSEAGPIAALSYLLLFVSLFYHTIKIRITNNFELDDIQNTINNTAPYLLVILFEVNFITSNSWLGVSFIIPMFIIFSNLNSIYDKNNKYYSVIFSKSSINKKINKNLENYINTN